MQNKTLKKQKKTKESFKMTVTNTVNSPGEIKEDKDISILIGFGNLEVGQP